MKKFDYICPCCNGKLSVPEEYLNNKCICPHCSEDFYIDQNDFLCVEKAIKKENNTYHFHCPFCTEEILIFEYDFAEEYVQCPICEKTIILNGKKQNSIVSNIDKDLYENSSKSQLGEKQSIIPPPKIRSLSQKHYSFPSKTPSKTPSKIPSGQCWRCKGLGKIQYSTDIKTCHICHGKGVIIDTPANSVVKEPSRISFFLSLLELIFAVVVIIMIFNSCEEEMKKYSDQYAREEWKRSVMQSLEKNPEYQLYKRRERRGY